MSDDKLTVANVAAENGAWRLSITYDGVGFMLSPDEARDLHERLRASLYHTDGEIRAMYASARQMALAEIDVALAKLREEAR